MKPVLRLAGPDDVDTVADIVADAFLRIPVISYLVPDPGRRRLVSRAWYRLYITHAIGGAGQVVMTEDSTAAAVWFDRTGGFTEPDNYAQHLADLAGDDLPRFENLDKQMDAHHPTVPHWHLLFLAVQPGDWRRGLGSALLEHTHRRLDEAAIPAYLEATGEQNRRLYQRHAYTDMAPATLSVADGTTLLRMWRRPRLR